MNPYIYQTLRYSFTERVASCKQPNRLFQIFLQRKYIDCKHFPSGIEIMCHEAPLYALNQEEPQRRACHRYQPAACSKSRSCIIEMDGELPVCKAQSVYLPAPNSFTRGSKARPILPLPNTSIDLYAAHRATVGKMIAASECADWQTTKSSSWDDALELL